MAVYNLIKVYLIGGRNKQRAEHSLRFFKTGPGEYGEGDLFLGMSMSEQRIVAKRYYKEATITDISALLKGKYHEERMVALLILVFKYKKAGDAERKKIFDFYVKNAKRVNNWDLVDVTCRDIVGRYIFDHPSAANREILYRLAGSGDLWERRIAIISTAYFISKNEFADTLKISRILMRDKHDLIHKAVGWMLREVGKRSLETERAFLDAYADKMPRTMLRYAIEKFPESIRKRYLSKPK